MSGDATSQRRRGSNFRIIKELSSRTFHTYWKLRGKNVDVIRYFLQLLSIYHCTLQLHVFHYVMQSFIGRWIRSYIRCRFHLV